MVRASDAFFGNMEVTPSSTTAGLIRGYIPPQGPGKKVDFVLHLDPEAFSSGAAHGNAEQLMAGEAAKRINELRLRDMPLGSINHTDYEALNGRPIAVSIETKRAGVSDVEAGLQIGMWLAAQWNMLRQRRRSGCDDQLEFLPAIIIRGHDWMFAATSREGEKTVS